VATDIRNFSQPSLRQYIGVVPQQIDLFAGTILENIAIGDAEPDLRKVLELSRLLGLDEFLEKLPDNLNTYLSEQGVNLSGRPAAATGNCKGIVP
jgi:ATP-binding cassette subfamily B protein